MPETTSTAPDFARYAELIAQNFKQPIQFSATVETAQAIQVERGVVFAQVLLAPKTADLSSVDRLIELAGSDRLSSLAVVDRANHHRPVYQGLLIYSWLQAYRVAYETLSPSAFGKWEEALRPWCDMLESELTSIDWPADGMPASRGASAAESVWMALALFAAGKAFVRDAWIDLASDTFGRLLRGESNRATFLLACENDNPEILWYHELVILHAAASYAVQSEDRTVAAAVARSTQHHFNEIQPDHATSQPWAVFPFIWNPQTRILADQILHYDSMQHPRGDDGVSLMLLADALYCLRLFLK
jgi:hypothetical protein